MSKLERARQGDPSAIAALINRLLANKGVTVKASRQGDCLQLLLTGESQPTNRSRLIDSIQSGVRKLEIPSIASLQIYYHLRGADTPSWSESVNLRAKFTTPEYVPVGAVSGALVGCGGMGCGLLLFMIPLFGWILGIFVIITSMIFAIQTTSRKAEGPLKGACPYCGIENVGKKSRSGFNCRGCRQRVLIKDRKFYQA